MSKFIAMQRLHEPWLISPTAHDAIKETLLGLEVDIQAEPVDQKPYAQHNGIAVLNLKGTMMKNPTPVEQLFLGATCTQAFCDQANEIKQNVNIQGFYLM